MRTLESFYGEIAAGEGGPLGGLLRGALRLASVGYRGLIAARNGRYDRDPLRVCHVSVPVVSVGNITTGGTGKTPMVIDVVTRLREIGRRPVVVSRGYKSGASQRSDELMLIERTAPGAVCVANPDRVAGAEQAVAQHGADVVVLDDGFQHRRMGRDLDIVLIDATLPFGFGYLLPRGLLREPLENLARADVLIITRADQVDSSDLDRLKRRIEALAPGRPILAAVHKPQPLCSLPTGLTERDQLDQGGAYLVSGIGNHPAFRRTVESLNIAVCGHARFSDHHYYRAGDLRDVCAKALARGAERVIVTEKDAVKLEGLEVDWALPVQVLGVRIDFCDEGGKIMDKVLREVMGGSGVHGGRKI